MPRLEDLLPSGTEAEWTCGHVGGAVCAECYRLLAAKANDLAEQIATLSDEIDRLRNNFRMIAEGHEAQMTKMEDAADEAVKAVLDKRDRMKAALEPFALEAECYDSKWTDDQNSKFSDFKIGDLRRARAALEGKPPVESAP